MPEVIVLQHIDCEPLGVIGGALEKADVSYRYVRAFAGEPVPRNMEGTAGLVVMGGPMGVSEEERYPWLTAEMRLTESALGRGLPVLGVCLGSQMLATVLGADVRRGTRPEIGWHPVTTSESSQRDSLWRNAPPRFTGFHWHGDVFDLPPGTTLLASSELTPCQAFRHGDLAYGILFHMEVTEAIIHDWTVAFESELAEAGMEAAPILGRISADLPPLQKIGQTVFTRWANLVTQ